MNEKGMQHGRNWNGHKINGYIATEKYDGCRAFWDGENLWSRGGIKINLPDSWRAVLPLGIPLDGEIYDGIDGLYRCGAAIKYGNFMRAEIKGPAYIWLAPYMQDNDTGMDLDAALLSIKS
jgi:hypothetical protein